MRLQITAKKMQIPQAFIDYAEKKLKKLDRFFGDEAEAKLTMSTLKDDIIMELTVKCDNLICRAKQKAADKNDALDACVDKIIRQIRKNKTKVEKRLKSGAFEVQDTDEVEEQSQYTVIKRKSFRLRPMNVDEAILQMNMLDHNFFMFKNGDTGEINVVYKRDDGNYAILEPSKE